MLSTRSMAARLFSTAAVIVPVLPMTIACTPTAIHRAHNSILVNGMTQTIGTEGYGWIPRWYEGEKISYIVGDASNAYGKITAPIWLKRGELSGTQYTPEKDGMRTN